LTSLLLDTHAFLWWMDGGASLSEIAREAISDPSTVVYLSAASAWEMSIKRGRGRLDSPTDVAGAISDNGFRELPVNVLHTQEVAELPPHHGDPFDRILIAQAKIEGLTIVTRDPAFEAYGIPLLAA
jgi:PIN domain nuclease of toxin-antitoxin system